MKKETTVLVLLHTLMEDWEAVNYVCAQVALWLYQKSAGYSKSAVTERAAAMLNTSGMDGMIWTDTRHWCGIFIPVHRIGHTDTIFSILIILIHRSYRPQHYPRLTFIPTEAAAAEKLAERPEAEKKAVNMRQAALQPVYLTV